MITFAVERWHAVRTEIMPLWIRHHAEIGEDADVVPLDPDFEGYATLDGRGRLHILTARQANRLVGYAIAIVGSHLHYASTVFAAGDAYWLDSACRGGRTAARMFAELERTLKERGVVKIVQNTKLAHDQGRLLAHLGYREAERIYVKVLA